MLKTTGKRFLFTGRCLEHFNWQSYQLANPFFPCSRFCLREQRGRARPRCISYEIPSTNLAFASRTAVLVGVSRFCRDLMRKLKTWSPQPPPPFPPPQANQSLRRPQSFSSKKTHSEKEKCSPCFREIQDASYRPFRKGLNTKYKSAPTFSQDTVILSHSSLKVDRLHAKHFLI